MALAEGGAGLAFLVVALFYFLAPVVGYGNDQRQSLALSLWIMIGVMGLALLEYIVCAASDTPPSKGLKIAFDVLGAGGGIAAMVVFVNGLKQLRK